MRYIALILWSSSSIPGNGYFFFYIFFTFSLFYIFLIGQDIFQTFDWNIITYSEWFREWETWLSLSWRGVRVPVMECVFTNIFNIMICTWVFSKEVFSKEYQIYIAYGLAGAKYGSVSWHVLRLPVMEIFYIHFLHHEAIFKVFKLLSSSYRTW